jgi:hypothetical protein
MWNQMQANLKPGKDKIKSKIHQPLMNYLARLPDNTVACNPK